MGICQNKGDAAPELHSVSLALTPIGPQLPKYQAYHTSVLVDDFEYSFGSQGVECNRGLQSHRHLPKGPPKVLDQGVSQVSPEEMLQALRPHFQAETYDLLRKNCNSFTDCCLFFLLGVRLDRRYRTIERIGASADRRTGFVRKLTLGNYKPNPQANGFQTSDVVQELASPGETPRCI
mmetsp:Transcript_55999/g.126352  ORF Transcript_55999/g.126352 Transcript_55999/m.126352 type:complete len:178 (+) Transcript_55999:41-574(+)